MFRCTLAMSNRSIQCQGIATSTKKRCCKAAKPGFAYCHLHLPRCDNKEALQCKGIAKSTKKQCRKTAKSGFEYCHLHLPCCQHKTDGTSIKASTLEKFDYRFHAVSGRLSTDPQEFRKQSLRSSKQHCVAVWDYRKHRDAYTSFKQKDLTQGSTELDHVLELHVVRDAFDLVKPQGTGFRSRKAALKERLKTVLNEKENLNFTLEVVNQTKFRGVYAFQKAYLMGTVCPGLVPYLKEEWQKRWDESNKNTRLRRRVTRRIGEEIVKSYDHVRDSLRDEDLLQGQLIELLHDNMVAMWLW
ncbi:expressed unknown protein [Seminavis robusta]|uniref:Uncharacterized protein n=1 Tax=Seminavis robusta TaxID=568900 RepID=A0A9N8DAG9_9STRA|nr:expressed unknown protein [Seminavis robusta]|eukprot:Sro60_g034510.1 n/a (300) ;mRNA; r:14750-15764